MNHKQMINKKRQIRSALSGRIINGREVVLVEEAVEYVKKRGYIVLNPSLNIRFNPEIPLFQIGGLTQ